MGRDALRGLGASLGADPPSPRLRRIRKALRGESLAAATFLALALFLHRGAVFEGGVIYKRDVHLVWHPQVEGFVRAVAGGAWPVWDPCPAFGQPLLPDASSQVLYPFTWLNLLMRPWTYYTLFSLLHSLLSAVGMYRLSRYLGASAGGSFVAGATWIASGAFLSLVDLWHHYATAAWIPWVFLTTVQALEYPSPRRVAAAGIVLAMQILAGSADVCAMTVLAVLVYAAAFLLDWRTPFGRVSRLRACAGLCTVALGLAISAALWMSALALAFRTPRWSLPEAVRTFWSVHPLGALELLFPSLWSDLPLSPALRDLLFESREPFLQSIYLGVPTLALVAGGLALQPGPRKLFFVALGGGAALLSLGRHFAFYDVAVLLLPPLRILRYPVKAIILATFAWGVLAGQGFDAWREGTASPRRFGLRLFLPLATLVALGLGGGLFLHYGASSWGPRIVARAPDGPSFRALLAPASQRMLVAALLASAALVLAVLRSRRKEAVGLAAALAVLAVGDLALVHASVILVAPRALYTHRPPLVDGLREMGATRLYVFDYTQRDLNRRYLKRDFGHALVSVPDGWDLNAAVALGMQQTLTPATAGRWALPTGFEIDYRGLHPVSLSRLTAVVRDFGPEARLRLLRLGAVSHVVALHSEGFEDLLSLRNWDTLLAEPVRVFGVPDPFPRVRVVGGALPADGIEGLEALIDPGFDPARQVLLPSGPTVPPTAAPGVARIVEERSDRVTLDADLQGPGYVILADAFDPGWRATLDGMPVPVLRANLAFRAVQVPAGRHRIEMAYRPPALLLGLALSATGLVSALFLLARPPQG